ncbi:uncharacterized protein LAJ45_06822 [Morchella importuna]|uniref:uncharacterized protein n=1 Tax=Morchella importuna TaxID=1174673 RepID=UPI001E8DDCDE|nr:uncharacterized protein LAJ45_06822 [Morchella importuna]KAH8149282.1 hypothetical protein LAJ45_06822 [Morchella importuna]
MGSALDFLLTRASKTHLIIHSIVKSNKTVSRVKIHLQCIGNLLSIETLNLSAYSISQKYPRGLRNLNIAKSAL